MSSSTRPSIDSLDSTFSPLSNPSAYPFPRIEGHGRSGSSGRDPTRRKTSNASVQSHHSTTHSVGGSLDIRSLHAERAVNDTGHNAISNLLQPSITRTGLLPSSSAPPGYRAPTTRDIPPVTLTNVPHVDSSAFKEYLAKIAPLVDSISRRREEEEKRAPSTPGTPTTERARPLFTRENSLTVSSPSLGSPSQRRRSSGHIRRRPNEPTPLSTVPVVYFEDDFHLENPRTFDVVSEKAEIMPSADPAVLPPRKSLATNAILQEKLSWYMDTVEIHLINSISTASPSFFAALGSLRDLQREAEESAAQIQKLRADLAELDRGMAIGGLEISRMRLRRRNIGKLFKATEQVHRVVKQVVHCEELVDDGRYEEATNAIERVDRLICGDGDGSDVTEQRAENELIDLSGLQVLQSITPGVHALLERIGHGFEQSFLDTLIGDLRDHVNKVEADETLRRWVDASRRQRGAQRLSRPSPQYMETDQDFRKKLSGSLAGLSRSAFIAPAADSYRNTVSREMKALIRKHLPSSSDEDADSVTSVATRGGRSSSQQEKSAILARNLRALDEQDAESLVVGVSTNISEALRRLGIQIKVLMDITSNLKPARSRATSPAPMSPPPPTSKAGLTHGQLLSPANGNASPRSPSSLMSHVQEDLVLALDMSSLLGQAVDVAQTQLSRLLKVRAEQTHRLPLQQFVRYITILRLFADECEAISGRSGQVLKNILNTQVAAYISHMAESQSQQIAGMLDAEQWEAQDFTEQAEAVLSRILNGMNADPETWTSGIKIWEKVNIESAVAVSSSTNGTNGEDQSTTKLSSKATAKPAYIDDTRFILVGAATTLLPMIDSFLALISSIPGIAQTAVPAIADILRTFNSRTSQLILGAGATRVAGLKNITTKHLALSSQALSFVIALIPYMREAVRRHTGGRNEPLGEFDKAKRLFQDHQLGIHDKLVEIMSARARSHAASMKKIDFDKSDESGPSAYMETLTKETGTLSRVLNRHLSEGDVNGIMVQIARNYREVWVPAFAEQVIATPKGKSRLIKDAELFETKLAKIEGFKDTAEILINGVKNRSVEAKEEEKKVNEEDASETKREEGGKDEDSTVMFEAE